MEAFALARLVQSSQPSIHQQCVYTSDCLSSPSLAQFCGKESSNLFSVMQSREVTVKERTGQIHQGTRTDTERGGLVFPRVCDEEECKSTPLRPHQLIFLQGTRTETGFATNLMLNLREVD